MTCLILNFHSNLTKVHICLEQQKRKIVEYSFNEKKLLLEIPAMNNITQVGVSRSSDWLMGCSSMSNRCFNDYL